MCEPGTTRGVEARWNGSSRTFASAQDRMEPVPWRGGVSATPRWYEDSLQLPPSRPSPRACFEERVRERIAGVEARLGLLGVTLRGQSLEDMVQKHFLSNPQVDERMLRQAAVVRIEDLTSSERVKRRVEDGCPNHRYSRSHRFAVGIISALTGLEPKELSEAAPDLGLMGSVRLNLYTRPKSEWAQFTTALHDATDYLKSTGVEGLNEALWGTESTFGSALRSYLRGPQTSSS